MKCPRCGLVTFDHLRRCPRCEQSFELVRPLTARSGALGPFLFEDAEAQERLRDRLHDARLSRRKRMANPLSGGDDPDAPEWFDPDPVAPDDTGRRKDGQDEPGPSSSREGAPDEERANVTPPDSDRDEQRSGPVAIDGGPGTPTEVEESSSDDDSPDELPFDQQDQPLEGFQDWREELRVRLKRIRARKAKEARSGSADSGESHQEGSGEARTPRLPGRGREPQPASRNPVGADPVAAREEEAAADVDAGGPDEVDSDEPSLEELLDDAALAPAAQTPAAQHIKVVRPEAQATPDDPLGDAELRPGGPGPPPAEIADDASGSEEDDAPDTVTEDTDVADTEASIAAGADGDVADEEADEDVIAEDREGIADAEQDVVDAEEGVVADAEEDAVEPEQDVVAEAEEGVAEGPRIGTPGDAEAATLEGAGPESAEDTGPAEAEGADVASPDRVDVDAAAEGQEDRAEVAGDAAEGGEDGRFEEVDEDGPEGEPGPEEIAGRPAREPEVSLDEEDEEEEKEELEFGTGPAAAGIDFDVDETSAAEPATGPAWDVEEGDQPEEREAAGISPSAGPLGERLAATVCDGLVLVAIAACLVSAAASANGQSLTAILSEAPVPLALAWGIFAAGYGLFFNGTCGQTIGRMVMKLRVVSSDEFSVGFRRAAVRMGASIVSILSLGLGALVALRDPQRRTLHDRLSHTRVVKA